MIAKKKRKDENEFLNEVCWCVKFRELWNPVGRWCWNHRSLAYTRRDSMKEFYEHRLGGKTWWIRKRKKGVVACVKVKLVEQP